MTPDKNSDEKLSAMRLLGSDIVQTPSGARQGEADHFMNTAERLVNEDPEHNVSLDQVSNMIRKYPENVYFRDPVNSPF